MQKYPQKRKKEPFAVPFEIDHKEELERTTQRMTRVFALARKLYETLDMADVAIDDKIAARQLFAFLCDKFGAK